MKKILVTRKLLRSCEDKALKSFDANLNLNDELYSQKKLIEMRYRLQKYMNKIGLVYISGKATFYFFINIIPVN